MSPFTDEGSGNSAGAEGCFPSYVERERLGLCIQTHHLLQRATWGWSPAHPPDWSFGHVFEDISHGWILSSA